MKPNPARRNFCGRTRREFLWETGCGFGAAALSSLLASDGFLQRAGAASLAPTASNPLASKSPKFAGQSQKRHLPVHVWRPQPHRHVRLQAGHGRHGRKDGRRQNLWPRRSQEPGANRRAALEVSSARPVRQMGQRAVSPSGRLRRRHRIHPFDDRRVADPRLGPVHDELRPAAERKSVARLVGELRLGIGEREPARLCRDARPNRRSDQRSEELVERLHAGHVRRHRVSRKRFADQRSLDARRHYRPAAARRARFARPVE